MFTLTIMSRLQQTDFLRPVEFVITEIHCRLDLIIKNHLKTSGISILSLDRVGTFDRPSAAKNCLS